MPTSRFTTTALRGAAPGLTRLAAALGGGGQQAYQQAFDNEQLMQSRMAQALSGVQRDEAAARKYDADAAQQRAETDLLAQRPGQREELAAMASGQPLPLVRAVLEATRTGQPAMVDGVGPEPDGSALRVPVSQDVQTRIGQALLRLAPVALNTKDIGVDDWAKAQGAYREQDLGDDVLAGRRTAADVGRAQAAVGAKPLYNSDASGAVLDLFGGALDTANPMAQASIGLKKEQAGAQRASAAQNYAAADNNWASAEKTRTEMRDGVNRGGAKAPTGYRWGADGTSLEPIPGGPADPATKGAKLAKPPTEGQAKALLFGSRMAVASEVFDELAKAGVDSQSWAKQAVEGLPLVGGAAGAAANYLFASPQEQQVEQAQRDFINAVLRRESGAAIAESEFANARRQYFPQPGDSPAVIRQKAANRRTAIAAFKAEFGEQLAPDFDRIVSEARAARKSPTKPGAAPSGGGGQNRTVTVDF